MPPWADRNAIRKIYLQARQLTIETGIKHEVDHIIPSNHELVCGLHVETNLQILTESENIKKSNLFYI
jgi:5-methylcytosine-specific restriction endonuclease McrA